MKNQKKLQFEKHGKNPILLSRSFLIDALKTAKTIPANPLDSDFVTFVIRIEEIDLSPYYRTQVVVDSASAETDGVAWFLLSTLVDFAQGKTEQIATPNGEPLRTVFWESLKPVLLDNPETLFIKQ